MVDTRPVSTDLLISKPKITVIDVSILASIGTNTAASENGIGVAPAAVAATAAAATAI